MALDDVLLMARQREPEGERGRGDGNREEEEDDLHRFGRRGWDA